jgi:FkbM family methyltransferase
MPLPSTIVVPTVYGPMMVNRYDINQTNALFKTGLAIDHAEIAMLAQLMRVMQAVFIDLTFLDIGANFGTYSIALARAVGPRGKVHSFEPQRLIHNLLAGSVALNSLTNVHCHNVAVGDHDGRVEVPQFDYSQPLNFGSIEFTGAQRERLTQTPGNDPSRVEYVPLTTIDRFDFDKVHVMKIDAEGMEFQVLDGAMNTIRRCRPVLYVEFVKVDREQLRQKILAENYAVHVNGINFLCMPIELSDRIRIEPPQRGAAG